MNCVVLIGRIVAKPEIRYTRSNKAVTNFDIAINRRDGEDADFTRIQVWNKTAENICTYLDKGSLIGIKGEIRTSKYEDRDGNKRNSVYVLADQVIFLENKKDKNIHSNADNVGQENSSEFESLITGREFLD